MKILKIVCLALCLLFTINGTIYAQVSGYGCLINGGTVYTEYLGMGHPYHPSNPLVRFYKSTGLNVPPNYNNYNGANPPTYFGYLCGYINNFGARSPYPAVKEWTAQGSEKCVISPVLEGSIDGNGDYVSYSYNNPTYCGSTPPTPVPLDDYIPFLILVIGGLGFYFVKTRRSIIIN